MVPRFNVEENSMSQLDPDDRETRIQRALNDAKRKDLEKKYGMQSSHSDSELDPEIEGDFLDHVEEFERQYQSAKRTTVREMAGRPDVKPLSELTPEELDSELFLLLKRLEAHSIEVDFLCEVEPAEQYRFLTEELLNEEMDDIRIPGMTSHFIYEEFHPNAEYDAKSAAEMFVRSLLSRNTEFIMTHFSKEELYDLKGKPLSCEQMQEKTKAFFNTYIETEDWEVTPTVCRIEGDYAQVEANTSWRGLPASATHWVDFSGVAKVRLKRSPYEGWDVIQATVPGWESGDSSIPGN
jgi:hypothetical protein